MGRSLMFGKRLLEHPREQIIQDLEQIFLDITQPCTDDDLSEFFGIKRTTTLLRVGESEGRFIRVLTTIPRARGICERCCSVYYGSEEDYPNIGDTYEITMGERIRFDNNESPFVYDVLYIKSTQPDVFTTWCLRTDGIILNSESLQYRGAGIFHEVPPSS